MAKCLKTLESSVQERSRTILSSVVLMHTPNIPVQLSGKIKGHLRGTVLNAHKLLEGVAYILHDV